MVRGPQQGVLAVACVACGACLMRHLAFASATRAHPNAAASDPSPPTPYTTAGPLAVASSSHSLQISLSPPTTLDLTLTQPATPNPESSTVNAAAVRSSQLQSAALQPPYPLVWFFSGFLIPPAWYSLYAKRLASYGYVVVQYSVRRPGLLPVIVVDRVELTFLPTIRAWIQQQVSQPSSSLYGSVIDMSRQAAVGHSRGAKLAALHYAAGCTAARNSHQDMQQHSAASQVEAMSHHHLRAPGLGSTANRSVLIQDGHANATAALNGHAVHASTHSSPTASISSSIRALVMIDPVDCSSATPESYDYPSAVKALASCQGHRQPGGEAAAAMIGAGISGRCNPFEQGPYKFWPALGPGSWRQGVPKAGHMQFAHATTWAGDWAANKLCDCGPNTNKAVIALALPATLAWLEQEFRQPQAQASVAAFRQWADQQALSGVISFEVKSSSVQQRKVDAVTGPQQAKHVADDTTLEILGVVAEVL